MTFNSLSFALFLPVFLLLYYAVCSRQRLRDVLLLVGSYFFYMSWYWQYAGLIIISTVIDYFVGRRMHRATSKKERKFLLLVSLCVNLGILAVFKYYNFFIESSHTAFAALGFDIPIGYHQLLLPVGISFYTFQTLSYTIDIYRKQLEPEESLIKFAVFVSFFPQLVAGPIVRAKDFLPQLSRPTFLSSENFNAGLKLVFIGLFKKIIIADLLAYLIVDEVFKDPSAFSSWDLLIGLYAYTFQIYCDFSGYSDIAIGVALMMGFKLAINFNRPYISQNPSDFWRRWHISLSTWLRDYLYIALGGNRGSQWYVARNLVLTMLLGGLWHGAAWNFVIWGAFHGLILVLTRNIVVEERFGVKMALKIFINFHLVVFGWLLFRVSDVNNFTAYITGLFEFSGGSAVSSLVYMLLLASAFMHFVPKIWHENLIGRVIDHQGLWVRSTIYSLMLFVFIGASIGAPSFIYFQF